jgi:nucleotide-binding universal stress UspA family protein
MNPALVALYFGEAEKQAKKYIEEIEERGRQEKVLLNCEVVIGAASVPAAILEYAKKCDAGFIVIGAKGTGAKKLLLGSVANAVVSHSDCPVLLVR